jgi:hypothetical protein
MLSLTISQKNEPMTTTAVMNMKRAKNRALAVNIFIWLLAAACIGTGFGLPHEVVSVGLEVGLKTAGFVSLAILGVQLYRADPSRALSVQPFEDLVADFAKKNEEIIKKQGLEGLSSEKKDLFNIIMRSNHWASKARLEKIEDLNATLLQKCSFSHHA